MSRTLWTRGNRKCFVRLDQGALFSARSAPSKSKQESLCTEKENKRRRVSDVGGPHPYCLETAHAGYLPDMHRL